MIKKSNVKKLIAILLAVSLIFGAMPTILASAEGTVTFNYGDSELRDATITLSAGTVTMPNPANGDTIKNNWSQYRGIPAVSGWINDETGKYYDAGEIVENVPGGATFTAVFGNNSVNFDDLSAGMAVYNDTISKPSYGSERASIVELEEGNNCVQFDGVSGENGNYQFAPIFMVGNSERFIGFNKSVQYKVTFKYRRTDSTSAESDLYVNFGAAIYNGWRTRQKSVQGIKVASTNKGMTEFETVTAVVTAPAKYSHSDGFASRAVAVAVDLSEGVQIQIDDFKIESTQGKSCASFTYGDGVAAGIGSDSIEIADANGNITLPTNESAKNLIWEYNDRYYIPGTTVNINELGNNVTFNAYFGEASFDYEGINTNGIKFTLSTGSTTTKNLFLELTRNPSYWRVPKGLSNTESGDYYGTALGHDRVGIIADVGNTGKGLQFTAENYSEPEYRNAVLFTHNPTSFTENDNITYSYVYYTPGKEYTMEFDYNTTSQVDVAIAFGVSTEWGNDNCGTQSVNCFDYDEDGNHITLESSDGEWKHASITVTAPETYEGYGFTSARVGVALRDNADADESRASYLDNIEFYSTELGKMKFNYGTTEEGFRVGTAVSSLPYGSAMPSPSDCDAVHLADGRYRGNLVLSGWICDQTGDYYDVGVVANGLPAGATFSPVYGNNAVDFNDLSAGMTVYNSSNSNASYGSDRASIVALEDGNNCVQFNGIAEDDKATHQFTPIIKVGSEYRFIGYNQNTEYKVTFKYRRTDNTDAVSDLYVNFGSLAYAGWRSSQRCVKGIKVATANKGMTEFETVTAFVTSPATYAAADGYYSKVVGIAADVSEGVEIQIDDFTIESTIGHSNVIFDSNIDSNERTIDLVKNNQTVTNLPTLSKDGFDFCGWYTNRLGTGSEVTSITGNGETQYYYAKWVPTLSGDGAAVSVNNNSISNYQLVLPENKTLVLSESLASFEDLVVSKGATTAEKSNKIIVEDTSDKAIENGNSSYTIKVENNNLVVNATDDAAMAGALDRLSQFVETAYEKNKVLNFAADFNFSQQYVADDSQYAYTWSDEFNAEDLNKSIWLKYANYKEPSANGYQIGENLLTGDPIYGNDNTGRYIVNTQGIYLQNGSAVIRAEKVKGPDAAGNDYYFINRKMSTIGAVDYTYGCIEIKAKLPEHPAAPAIWIYSSRDAATSAEIDLHEGIGRVSGYENNQQIVSNLHAAYHKSSDDNKWKSALDASQDLEDATSERIYLGTSKTNFDDAYHIYSVKWTPDEVVFALDGEVYYTYNFNTDTDLIDNAKIYDTDSPFNGLTAEEIKECFSKPMYICFANTMGTIDGEYGPLYEDGDPEQADLLVDYVRVYQSADNEGSTFEYTPYSQEEIIEVEKSEKAFIKEMGIEDRGETTKTVVMSGDGIETETIKINVGDSLPVNYAIGSKYIYGWTDGENSVKTYKDPSKTYTPQFIDLNMLDITYKVSDAGDGNSNLLFTSTVDSNWADYSKAGFVYSESLATPTIGANNCISVETTKVYEDGLISGSDLLDSEAAGYTTYSKYMFNFALKDIALSGRENDINVRSYVVLPDGRVVYGDVLTISTEEVLEADVVSEFDCFIIERLTTGATLDNLVDYNDDDKVDIFDLIRAKKISVGLVESDEEINAMTLTGIRKILLFYNASKVK